MAELLGELERQHARVEGAWRGLLDDRGSAGPDLNSPLEWRYCEGLPTLGDATVFLAVSHEVMHLGQLAAWRRARGLPSALSSF